MKNEIETLERVVEAVRRAHANIAPTYEEYYQLAYGIAASCGEAGRPYFHELCAYSPKYRPAEAEKYFSYALQHANGKIGLGSVVHLAQQAGCEIEFSTGYQPSSSLKPSHSSPSFPPCAHALYKVDENPSPEGNLTENEENEESEEEFIMELPVFPHYDWPPFLQRIINCGATPAQRDAMLLATFGILGATLNRMLYTFYAKKKNYATTQTFILGEPASGKGAVAWIRQMAMPFHEELLANYRRKKEKYLQEHRVWESLSYAQRKEIPEPQEPPLVLFLIPGNNSSTGIKDNLITADGVGLICETEADTVGSAIGSDYGHWSDTMRKGFDHDEVSFYRRTDREYKQCVSTCFSMVLTGTPSQLTPIIPNCNDGQQSRTLFYWMPSIPGWEDQFECDDQDYVAMFYRWGVQWKYVVDAMRRVAAGFCLKLTDEQQAAFNAHFAQIFERAGIVHGGAMKSAVARLGLNLCRLMCIVALLRAWEEFLPVDDTPYQEAVPEDLRELTERLLNNPLLRPAGQSAQENVQDRVVSCFDLSIRDDDFQAVLQLAEPLYLHSGRVVDMLPDLKALQPVKPQQQTLFDLLPLRFTRTEALQAGEKLHMSSKAVDSLLARLIRKGILIRTGRGEYQFKTAIRSTRAHGGKDGDESEGLRESEENE